MEKKFIVSWAIGCLALGMVVASILQSCKTRTLGIDRYIAVPYIQQDTIKPKPLTEAEKQAMIDRFYQYGYNKYYGPQFERLESVITQQTKSISSLTTTLQQMRVRSIHNRDSMQRIEVAKDSENDKLRHDLLIQQTATAKAEQQQVSQNLTQINQLKSITNFLLWGFASLWAIFLLAVAIFYIWFKKLKRDIKRANYV